MPNRKEELNYNAHYTGARVIYAQNLHTQSYSIINYDSLYPSFLFNNTTPMVYDGDHYSMDVN